MLVSGVRSFTPAGAETVVISFIETHVACSSFRVHPGIKLQVLVLALGGTYGGEPLPLTTRHEEKSRRL